MSIGQCTQDHTWNPIELDSQAQLNIVQLNLNKSCGNPTQTTLEISGLHATGNHF